MFRLNKMSKLIHQIVTLFSKITHRSFWLLYLSLFYHECALLINILVSSVILNLIVLLINSAIVLASFRDYFLRSLQRLQNPQLFLDSLFLNNKQVTSLAGLPNFCLKYSSKVLLDRRLLMQLILISEAVDLLISFEIFSFMMH